MKPILALRSAFAVLALTAGLALAQDTEFRITIQDHKFSPDEITVPANQKVKLVIENKDATPEEFESKELKAEKVIPGKSTGTVIVGPLKPGRYSFIGEFNAKTAKGVVIAK